MHFSWIFLGILKFYGEFWRNVSWKDTYNLPLSMFVSKPKSKKNRWIEWKTFQGYLKNKKEKKHMKRLSFITHFKIEFLVPFTSCRKVPGKKPAGLFEVTNEQQIFSKYFKSILQFLQILQDFLYIVFNEKSFNEVSLYRKYITITKQKVKIPWFHTSNKLHM